MKKLLLALFFIVVIVGGLAAHSDKKEVESAEVAKNEAEPIKPVLMDIGVAVWEHFYAPGNKIDDKILPLLEGFRIGIFSAVRVNLSDTISVGGELGVAYMGVILPNETNVTLLDMSVDVFIRVKLWRMEAMQPYAGVLLGSRDLAGLRDHGNKPVDVNMHVGTKFLSGGFFVDCGFVISYIDESVLVYPRLGIGFQFNDIF